MILLLKTEGRQQSGDLRAAGLRARLASGVAAAQAALKTAPSHNPLTELELDVLELLEARLSNREIAACLMVSVAAVRRHAANAYRKLLGSNGRPDIRLANTPGLPSGRASRRGIVPAPRVLPIVNPLALHGRRQPAERARTLVIRPVGSGLEQRPGTDQARAPVYPLRSRGRPPGRDDELARRQRQGVCTDTPVEVEPG